MLKVWLSPPGFANQRSPTSGFPTGTAPDVRIARCPCVDWEDEFSPSVDRSLIHRAIDVQESVARERAHLGTAEPLEQRHAPVKIGISGGLGCFLALGFAVVARAELVEVTYTEYVRGMLQLFQEVAQARGLNAPAAESAQRLAATWVHLGPCKGNPPGEVDAEVERYAIGHMFVVAPASPMNAAFLEYVALMTRENFGREPRMRRPAPFAQRLVARIWRLW